MSNKRIGHTIRAFLLIVLFALLVNATVIFPQRTLAEGEKAVPVTMKLSPNLMRYAPNQTIKIEAWTKMEGTSYEVVELSIFDTDLDKPEDKITVPFETKVVDGHYVTTASFRPEEDAGVQIGNVGISYKIVMRSETETWVGKAVRGIQVDNMPGPMPTVESKVSYSPSQDLRAGTKIKFTVMTPYKGPIAHKAEFFVFPSSKKPVPVVEKVRTRLDRKKNMYITTGYITPQKAGEYIVDFSLRMKDENSDDVWAGAGEAIFMVLPDGIEASISPQTATMKLGEELYLLLSYTIEEKDIGGIVRVYSHGVKEEKEEYDRKNQIYKVLLKFNPAFSQTYQFEAVVKNQATQESVTATTEIVVK